MRIKSLDVLGFKSFADRVQLSFGEGITGVVGPNGCGKSNIVDAIRWCMGEMSAKQLRGRAMQDVIFAGSDTRGPTGMAEVTLTLRNDGNVPAPYRSYDEIACTRRLHRDGTSEYLINRSPVRLKDITDLFLGTGVGTRAYSIIEQGRIGFIVSSRPEDRRSLIEEVAGISKFKARRKAAERRMHATDQNLSRVGDIINELERQLRSLRRHAQKAGRYKKLKAELRDLDLHAACADYLRLAAVEKVQRREREKLEELLAVATVAVEDEEANLEGERVGLVDQERLLVTEQEKFADLDAKLAALERDLEHWQSDLDDSVHRSKQAAAEVEEAKERIAQVQTERRDLEAHIQTLKQAATGDQRRLELAAADVAERQAAMATVDESMDALRRDAVELVHQAAKQRAQAAGLEKQFADVDARLKTARHEQVSVATRQEEVETIHQEVESKRAAAAAELADWRSRHAGYREQFERVRAEVAASEARILALKGELAERRSRLESLEAIARRLEGYSDGVRTLMQPDAGGTGPAVDGIKGLVTDIIEARPQYERAIEAALGEKLQYLIVESHRAGVEAIEYLKGRAGGRSGFIPVEPRSVAARASVAEQPGLVGPALACVRVAEEYGSIAEYLLGEVMVVEGITDALEIWARNGQENALVTVDGELLDPAGVLSGGSSDGSGLLASQREIRELTDQVRELNADLHLARSRHEQQEKARIQLEVNVQQLEKDIHTGELEQVEIAKDLEAATLEAERLADRREVLQYEIEQGNEDLAAIDREASEAGKSADAAETGKAEIEARLADLAAERNRQSSDLESRTDALTALKVQLAASEEKLAGSRVTLERLAHAEADYRRRIERGVASINESNAAVIELKRSITQGEVEAKRSAEEVHQGRAKLMAARSRYEKEREGLTGVEQSLRERRRENQVVSESLMQLKMDLQKLDLERGRVMEQVAERHDVNLLNVITDYHLRPLPGPEAIERRAQIERAIKNLGPINLTAIEECQAVERRFDFLRAQRDDLVAAFEALKRAIHRINRASRVRFREAFAAVNDMFEKVFPRLFRGGEARLELLAHDDVLEAGVDIIAQPPGKKLQSVSLLSGGEKALTATALIFAIFLIKPSPFCVLDEVDAPLDDANVGRFTEMLREISGVSQFIVITHNKQTMTEADRLYGVTMEDPGMSKIVSVDLQGGGGDEQAA